MKDRGREGGQGRCVCGGGGLHLTVIHDPFSSPECFCATGSSVSRVNVSMTWWAKARDNVHEPHTLEEKTEPKQNRVWIRLRS